MEGASVVLFNQVTTESDTALTDENGHFSIFCEEGSYTVTFSMDGYLPQELPLELIYGTADDWEFADGHLEIEAVVLTKMPEETGNVMMSDHPKDILVMGLHALGGKYKRTHIRTVTFLDTLDDMPEDAWDVSEAQNGSVMAWATPYKTKSDNNDTYNLFIAGDGGVDANPDCSYLFYRYGLVSINFNRCFYTGNVENMAGMFRGAGTVASLDLSSFDTSEVTDMQEMFYSLIKTKTIDVSSFRTPKVKNMRSMFWGCESVSYLDVSGFTFESLEDASYMFGNCGDLIIHPFSEDDMEGVNIENIYAGVKGFR